MLVQRFASIVGSAGIVADADVARGYRADWRGLFEGEALCVLRPGTVEQVSQILKLCHAERIGVVPQGGNTNLTVGAVPDRTGQQIVLSTSRLRRIRDVDAVDMTIVAEAGVTIAELQAAAIDVDTLFPLSFAAEGSATLGGAISTNAGGTAAVRYGSTRDLLLGLEVVLPDGRVWNGLRRLHKDNAGYALRHLFAGAEGTLGVITAAAMKLAPLPRAREVAFCALPSEDAVGDFWMLLRAAGEGAVRAAEYISGTSLDLVVYELGLRAPVHASPHYVLVELTSARAEAGLRDRLEGFLAEALEQGLATDAVIAQNEQQAASFWRLREDQTEAQKRAGLNFKHDVAVPVSKVGELLVKCRAALEARFPDVLVAPFGHLGDGNIHMNIIRPPMPGRDTLPDLEAHIGAIVYEIAAALGGTFSAEHGIGTIKVKQLETTRSAVELDMMRVIKDAFDGQCIMNPGKVLSIVEVLPI
jgi:FAD/FMN-containing dehydrogenase